MNKIFILGRLGKDPESRSTNSGLTVAKFSVATTKRLKDKQEATTWHSCVAYGKLADICVSLLKKGDQVLIEGEMNFREYEGKNGEKRFSSDLIVNEMTKVSSGGTGGKKPEAQRDAFDDDSVPF